LLDRVSRLGAVGVEVLADPDREPGDLLHRVAPRRSREDIRIDTLAGAVSRIRLRVRIDLHLCAADGGDRRSDQVPFCLVRRIRPAGASDYVG
jgi:hypothetical protein